MSVGAIEGNSRLTSSFGGLFAKLALTHGIWDKALTANRFSALPAGPDGAAAGAAAGVGAGAG